VVYLTGIGPLDNPLATGVLAKADPLSRATLPYSVTIGSQTAQVYYLGLAPGFIGLAQANVQIPSGLAAGKYALRITVGGVASNAANIFVQ
jgi:uncharacterized protein (TIGR03437 family)